ncbi:MAG: biotin--[acetyl-CoA-carboxylase] ligase [Gammaproteobacteria bacterium]|nr:biotin--[acetyl-CoA-carboxylase] ligase [Gammaproteobacteria bacterium]NNC55951.1 biotin--[acetyl-CoA-carboxylase] ligase [Woeseiaceae bacterium]
MKSLSAEVIRRALDDATTARLGELEIFTEIESTNSYLMQQAGPAPGQLHVVATDNQTAGRGRHGRTWQSPPGSGLCLSMAYAFASQPAHLSALTLAVGLGVIETLQAINVHGVQLKWPNDLIVEDGKLGGILTEAQTQAGSAVTVVTGIGLNIDLGGELDLGAESGGVRHAVDMKTLSVALPARNRIAASIINGLCRTFVDFEASGFMKYKPRWHDHDWLLGREVTIDTPHQKISGVANGVADDGALLIDTRSDGTHRVTSGTVLMAGNRRASR